MNRRHLLTSLAGLAASGLVPGAIRGALAAADPVLSDRTRMLLQDSLILDMTGANAPVHPISLQTTGFETWIAKYHQADVTWLSMTASSDHTKSTGQMLHALAASRRYILERPDEYVLVERAEDIIRAKREGKLGVNFNFQGSNPLEGNIDLVAVLRELGVGHMLLAYNHKNLAAGGSHDRDDPGLSPFGETLVREMNRVGMVVDCTHMSKRSTMEIFEVSSEPVIFSHSVARALRDHERNIDDEQIRGCARTGGVIGLNGVAVFMSKDPYDTSAATLFRHLDYIVEVAGPEHVGLGLDHVPGHDEPLPVENVVPGHTALYGEDQYPPANRMAIAGPSVIAPLTEEMVRHGYSDEQIRGILGENFMRVFRDAWA